MNTTRQPPLPATTHVRAGEAAPDTQSDDLDEALEESFPASDPVAISITAIEPDTEERKGQRPESNAG